MCVEEEVDVVDDRRSLKSFDSVCSRDTISIKKGVCE